MTFDVFFIFFTDRMGKLFRENPIQIAFPEAVNLFSARAKFVREGSQKSTVRSHCLIIFIEEIQFAVYGGRRRTFSCSS